MWFRNLIATYYVTILYELGDLSGLVLLMEVKHNDSCFILYLVSCNLYNLFKQKCQYQKCPFKYSHIIYELRGWIDSWICVPEFRRLDKSGLSVLSGEWTALKGRGHKFFTETYVGDVKHVVYIIKCHVWDGDTKNRKQIFFLYAKSQF